MKKLIFLSTAFGLFSSTVTVHAQNLSDDLARVILIAPDKALPIGRGIYSLSEEIRGDCVKHDPIDVLTNTGQVVVYQAKLITSRREFQEFTAMSASLQASGIIGMNASASASLSNELSINSYDVNYLAKVSVTNRGQTLQAVSLKESIIAELSKQQDPMSWFLQTCGDSFVTKIVSGGDLIASFNLSTTSTSETSTMTAQLRGASLTFSAQGDFAKSMSKLQESNSLSISLLRSGTNGVELPESLDALMQQIRKFPKDANDSNGVPLRAITQSYSVIPNLPNIIRIPLQQKSQNIRLLVDTYNKIQDEIGRIDFITNHVSQFYLDPFDLPVLAGEIVAFNKTKDLLKQQMATCLQENRRCNEPLPDVPVSKIYPGRK